MAEAVQWINERAIGKIKLDNPRKVLNTVPRARRALPKCQLLSSLVNRVINGALIIHSALEGPYDLI